MSLTLFLLFRVKNAGLTFHLCIYYISQTDDDVINIKVFYRLHLNCIVIYLLLLGPFKKMIVHRSRESGLSTLNFLVKSMTSADRFLVSALVSNECLMIEIICSLFYFSILLWHQLNNHHLNPSPFASDNFTLLFYYQRYHVENLKPKF